MTNQNQTAHQEKIEATLAAILREKSGFELAELDRDATFLELGFDSLFLIQLSQTIRKKFKVKVTFRNLIEEIASVGGLVEKLVSECPPSTNAPAPGGAVPLNRNGKAPENRGRVSPPASAASETQAEDEIATRSSTNRVAEMAALETATVNQTQEPRTATPAPPLLAGPSRPTAALQASPAIAMPTPAAQPASANSSESQTLSAIDPAAGNATALQQIVLQQTALMSKHLELLSGRRPTAPTAAVAPARIPETKPSASREAAANSIATTEASPVPKPVEAVSANAESTEECNLPKGDEAQKKHERFGPYKPVRKAANHGLTSQQQQHLDEFIARYTARTAQSKKHAQTHRDYFADPRGVAGYRRIWKTMVYQIVVERSQGSKLWDIDGNEYIDIAMGFGLNLFGQSPDFVTKALQDQLEKGVEVGPQSPLAGEVARLLCDFSRKERATFCNTGSEAVMAALRLARTVTGKSKCVFFNKDYHGNFDEVLLRSNGVGESRRTGPAAPGVPQAFADNAIVLDYGTEEALRVIEERADEIASVLIEPVQSADPFIQPKEFLQQVRQITRDNDIAMIMDEVITGFRAKPGGAQEWFDVWGDMSTYGKVLGGGMPIGALAGSAEYMDALDGGTWRYEDDSEPEADMTFFAGTFVRHPIALTAAYQILMKLKEEGPELQEQLTARTTSMVARLNEFFERELFPIRVAQFASLFRFMFPADLEFADMLYFHLLDRGIFTRGWGDNCFLSTEHSDEDVERIIKAVQESCLEIRRGGFFPGVDRGPADPLETGLIGAVLPSEMTHESTNDIEIQSAFAESDRASLLTEIQDEGDLPPLFCMPAADGMTRIYHELSDYLGPEQPMYGLTSPGIFGEAIPDTLEELAARFVEEIQDLQPEGPYYLIGYCSGGTIALEVAQQLVATNQEVALVAGIESYNWLNAPSSNPTRWVQAHYEMQRIQFHLRNFLLLGMREKVAFMRSKLGAAMARTKVWSAALTSFGRPKLKKSTGVNLAEVWKKHDELSEAYVPRQYPGKLIQFRPRRDYKCHLGDELTARDGLDIRRLRAFPAGTMVRPFVEELATAIQSEIRMSLDALAKDAQANSPALLGGKSHPEQGSVNSTKNTEKTDNMTVSQLSYF